MNISNLQIDARARTFTADLDAGPGYDAALTALNLDPNFGYVLEIQGELRVYGVDDGASVELDGPAFIVHPVSGATLSFDTPNLDTSILDELLFEKGYNDSDVQQEFSEMQYAAAEAAWESYNDR